MGNFQFHYDHDKYQKRISMSFAYIRGLVILLVFRFSEILNCIMFMHFVNDLLTSVGTFDRKWLENLRKLAYEEEERR